jgi:hypothetical protein
MIFLSGCMRTGSPKLPAVISSSKIGAYSPSQFDIDYASYKELRSSGDEKSLEKARVLRNAMIDSIKSYIDMNYHKFESKLFLGRATENILFDFAELGIAAATNITNGERIKDILAVSLTGIKGTRLSIDKNLFLERATEIIVSKMRASRKRFETRLIEKKTNLPVNNYSLEEAFGDLVEYFYAGTLQAGLQELAEDAGQDVVQAKEEARTAEDLRIATQEEFDNSKKLRAKLRQLSNALGSSDRQRADEARKTIKEALAHTKINIKLADDATDKELLDALVREFRRANREPERIPILIEALKIQ